MDENISTEILFLGYFWQQAALLKLYLFGSRRGILVGFLRTKFVGEGKDEGTNAFS